MTLIVCVLLGAWLMLHPQETIEKLGRLHEVGDQLQTVTTQMLERYEHIKLVFVRDVLAPESVRDVGLMLGLSFSIWYLAGVLINLSIAYAFLILYAWATRAAALSRSTALVLLGYVVVNFVVTFPFFVEHMFLAKRYLIAFQ